MDSISVPPLISGFQKKVTSYFSPLKSLSAVFGATSALNRCLTTEDTCWALIPAQSGLAVIIRSEEGYLVLLAVKVLVSGLRGHVSLEPLLDNRGYLLGTHPGPVRISGDQQFHTGRESHVHIPAGLPHVRHGTAGYP